MDHMLKYLLYTCVYITWTYNCIAHERKNQVLAAILELNTFNLSAKLGKLVELVNILITGIRNMKTDKLARSNYF